MRSPAVESSLEGWVHIYLGGGEAIHTPVSIATDGTEVAFPVPLPEDLGSRMAMVWISLTDVDPESGDPRSVRNLRLGAYAAGGDATLVLVDDAMSMVSEDPTSYDLPPGIHEEEDVTTLELASVEATPPDEEGLVEEDLVKVAWIGGEVTP